VAEDGASSVSTPIRADNGATVTDNGGTQLAIAYNGFDRLVLKAYNPSGSYINAASLETTSGANITVTDDIRETRFNAAIAREITTGTATTYQVDGRTSFVRIPSSATTTTINLPEIVNGAATTNQVNVGYELYFSINRPVAVTINRVGTDVLLIDGVSGSSTSLQTTANIIFAKKLIASGLDEWTVIQ
jgi:YD repeat-containing protein